MSEQTSEYVTAPPPPPDARGTERTVGDPYCPSCERWWSESGSDVYPICGCCGLGRVACTAINQAASLAARLRDVEAERDAVEEGLRLVQARLRRAEAALREIIRLDDAERRDADLYHDGWRSGSGGNMGQVARAALAPSDGGVGREGG